MAETEKTTTTTTTTKTLTEGAKEDIERMETALNAFGLSNKDESTILRENSLPQNRSC